MECLCYTWQEVGANEDFRSFNKSGFLENLLEDYMRVQYIRGSTPILSPRDFLVMDDKVQMGLQRYEFNIQNMVPEYATPIVQSGWTNMFSLALALENKNDVNKALKVAQVALELVSAKDRKKYPFIVRQLEELIQRLSQHEH